MTLTERGPALAAFSASHHQIGRETPQRRISAAASGRPKRSQRAVRILP